MGWDRANCPGCGKEIRGDAALKASLDRVNSIFAYHPLQAPLIFGLQCPECGRRFRAPYWPLALPIAALWIVVIGGGGLSIARSEGFLEGVDLVPFAWLGFTTLCGSLVAALIACLFAKPVDCGRW